MKGCRPLNDQEIEDVYNILKCQRDKVLLILGIRTGFRISEILSLKIQDVVQHGKVASQVTVAKCNTKGKIESKTQGLEDRAKREIKKYLNGLPTYNLQDPLFKSTKSDKSITRMQAHRILKDAFDELQLEGTLATHSLRKTFANQAHKSSGYKIEETRVALHHRSLTSTQAYVPVNQEKVDYMILNMWKKGFKSKDIGTNG